MTSVDKEPRAWKLPATSGGAAITALQETNQKVTDGSSSLPNAANGASRMLVSIRAPAFNKPASIRKTRFARATEKDLDKVEENNVAGLNGLTNSQYVAEPREGKQQKQQKQQQQQQQLQEEQQERTVLPVSKPWEVFADARFADLGLCSALAKHIEGERGDEMRMIRKNGSIDVPQHLHEFAGLGDCSALEQLVEAEGEKLNRMR